MDKKAIYQDLPPEDRKAQMAADAVKFDNIPFLKELTQEEIDVKNQQVSSNCIKVYKLREELKEIKSDFKDRIDPLEEETKKLCRQVETGLEEVTGTLFYFPDFETNMMNIYDELGLLVQSRRLLPEEKQARLFVAHSKTGTEG
jgi:hypothetical protein